MEVHAHAHNVPIAIGRKKWTHYLWEFLMLFLAVFCGFLAENYREHLIEHQREKKYIRSLISDLKGDTAAIRFAIDFSITKFHGLDTLTTLLNKESLGTDDEKQLYNLNRRYATNLFVMVFNDRTMRQLLNSGNLRLIRAQSISDSIMNYYGPVQDDISEQGIAYGEIIKRLQILSEDIFDQSAYLIKMGTDSSFYRDLKPDQMKLITHERNVLKKYTQTISMTSDILSNYLSMLFYIRTMANSLLQFLQNEYDMK